MKQSKKVGLCLVIIGTFLMILPVMGGTPLLASVRLTTPSGAGMEVSGISPQEAITIGVGGFLVLVGAWMYVKGK